MANSTEKNKIQATNWVSSFSLTGHPKINDYTFKIDATSEKSDWTYNSMNLGIDCGDKCGTVYCELMGGYSASRNRTIFAHGKNDDGSDNFKQRIEVDWNDRMGDVVDQIGDACFTIVELERTVDGKNFRKKFLSPYDAVAYIKDHLSEDSVVNVYGRLHYSMYKDEVRVQKTVSRIVLSKAKPENFGATFKQSILLDRDSVDIKNVDRELGVLYLNARVLDYVKEYNGIEIRGNFPYTKTFELDIERYTKENFVMVYNEYLKVKKGVTQINYNGYFIESGAITKIAMEDLPPDVLTQVKLGVITMDEATRMCSNGKRTSRMVLDKPDLKKNEDTGMVSLQKFEERYTEDELSMSQFTADDEDDDVLSTPSSAASVAAPAGDLSWLDELNNLDMV